MIGRVVIWRREILTFSHHSKRIRRSELEVIQMSQSSYHTTETLKISMDQKYPLVKTLDERFIGILKTFKWGPDAEKALDVLKLTVNHRLVNKILKIDDEVSVKIHFVKWAVRMRNFKHDSSTYMSLIHCLDEAGHVGELLKTVREMVQATCIISPAELSEIMKILRKFKMANEALSIFYCVRDTKCKLTPDAYNSLILMLVQKGYFEKAHEIYNAMCNEGTCSLDAITYEALISAFSKLGFDDYVIKLFDKMVENGMSPSERDYSTLLGILFKQGRVEKALDLVQEMRERGCALTIYTYTELIKGLGKVGKVKEALSCFLNMWKEGRKPDAVIMNFMMGILVKAGCLEDAFRMFDEIRSPNVVTYNILIKALFESNTTALEAYSWFEKMKKNGITPSAITYSILIDGFCKTNRVDEALHMLEQMHEKGFPPHAAAYCAIIDALGKARYCEAANKFFQELKAKSGHLSARVYAVMIKHFGKCRRPLEAVDLFNEMKNLGQAPDVYAYNALLSGLVRLNMMDEAYSMIRTMEHNGCFPNINSYNIILSGVVRTGGPKHAIDMLDEMRRSRVMPDALSYNIVLGCVSRAGMHQKAVELMQEMDFEGFEYDKNTYSLLHEAVSNVDGYSRNAFS